MINPYLSYFIIKNYSLDLIGVMGVAIGIYLLFLAIRASVYDAFKSEVDGMTLANKLDKDGKIDRDSIEHFIRLVKHNFFLWIDSKDYMNDLNPQEFLERIDILAGRDLIR